MFPILRQRLFIVAAAVVGGLVWMWAVGPLRAADGSSGLSLFDARAGVLVGVLVLLLAGLPALVLGLIASAAGHPLAGVFTVSTALIFVAGAGGPIEGYLHRHPLPGAFGWLLAEAALWAALVALIVGAMGRLRGALEPMVDWLKSDSHGGESMRLGVPDARSLAAGAVCLLGGGVMSGLLLQSEQMGQVIGALLLAFVVGGLLAQIAVPQANPLPALLTPVVLGAAFYAHAWLGAGLASEDQALEAWYRGELWGPALVLPIHYASAGVSGCAMGLGLGQGINRAREMQSAH